MTAVTSMPGTGNAQVEERSPVTGRDVSRPHAIGQEGMAAQVEQADAAPESKSGISLERLDAELLLPDRACDALKRALMAKRIYDSREDLRLAERGLARDLGISRTPVREALLRLQHEGLVRTLPRRGVFVVRNRNRSQLEVESSTVRWRAPLSHGRRGRLHGCPDRGLCARDRALRRRVWP